VAKRALFALGVAALLASACTRDKKPAPGAAPSASVITIVNALGACENIAECDRLCDAGSADQCRRLGAAFQFGQGTAQDEARATELYEKACALGNAFGCVSAGQSYEYRHGVNKDDSKAAAFYLRACDMGYVGGCLNYGIMLENGRGVPRDDARALAYYDRGCRDGLKVGCEHRDRLKRALVGAADAGHD
jgi:hypothetical protein